MEASKKRIAVLGSTGSIGTQTLDIIALYPDLYDAVTLIAGTNVDALIEQAVRFKPRRAIIAKDSLYPTLKAALEPLGIAVGAGEEAIIEAMQMPDTDMVVTATVGYSGLRPTLAAIEAGKEIALANKETLVVAGELVTKMLRESSSRIIPVDSEHSAIYQCLAGEDREAVQKLIITASGGPFRHHTMEQLMHVTPADALRHPNWSMGAKITIDSATMLNKAFEIIEARWLFDIEPDKITAVVHPQSIVHSMVEFTDGAVKAQLGMPDMHLPISYALGLERRLPTGQPRMSLKDYASLTFEEPDAVRFPCLGMAHFSLHRGGNTACVVNAANEIANEAFRHGRIGFTDIYSTIMECVERMPYVASPTLTDYIETNNETRHLAETLIHGSFSL